MKLMGRTRESDKPQPSNPFLVPAPEPEPEEHLGLDEIVGRATSFTNARAAEPSAAQLWPVGGGVGVSTIVAASDGALKEPDGTRPEKVVIVATTAADRLARARELLEVGQTPEGSQIVGIVLVHDQPKISRTTTKSAQRVIRMADHGWVIPWLPYLRETLEPPKRHPLRFRKTIADLVKKTRDR